VEWAQCITIKVPCLFFSLRKSKEEKVIERFHGVDRHKKFSTISVVNREGQEIQFLSACWDLRRYIEDLGPEDAVILEASSGAFWWADRIEAKGAACTILDPHRHADHQGFLEENGQVRRAQHGEGTLGTPGDR
jgi:hypothetical protein